MPYGTNIGEELILSDALGKVIDQVAFRAQERDISYGRWPNGTGDFYTMSHNRMISVY
jgi:hypothetical protein